MPPRRRRGKFSHNDLGVADQLAASAKVYSATVEFMPVLDWSDSLPFHEAGIPTAMLMCSEVPSQTTVYHRPEDDVEKAHMDQKQMQFLYRDGTDFHFMDTDNYEQIHMSEDTLGDAIYYLVPETSITVDLYEGNPVGIELPKVVELEVVETLPRSRRHGDGPDQAGCRQGDRQADGAGQDSGQPPPRCTGAGRQALRADRRGAPQLDGYSRLPHRPHRFSRGRG
jgi:hypothetical protein